MTEHVPTISVTYEYDPTIRWWTMTSGDITTSLTEHAQIEAARTILLNAGLLLDDFVGAPVDN